MFYSSNRIGRASERRTYPEKFIADARGFEQPGQRKVVVESRLHALRADLRQIELRVDQVRRRGHALQKRRALGLEVLSAKSIEASIEAIWLA